MQMKNSDHSWGLVARLLHWGMALLVLVQIGLGIAAVEWRLSPVKIDLFVWHKSLGVLLGILVLCRLMWRGVNPTPGLPSGMAPWQRRASRSSHILLYVCLLGLPLSGWVIQSASDVPFKIFWLFPLPDLVESSKAVADAGKRVHGFFMVMLLAVLIIHIAAALHHHWIKRDSVLVRMWSGREGRS
jgi:cytochrome b561